MTVPDQAAAAWGTDASSYERARPGWPADALDWLWSELALDAGSAVLDLAAGTGKLTRELVLRGSAVTAVEPLAGMRAELERSVPQADIREGTADAIPLDAGSVDAVFVAEAFHWFAAPATVAEIRRVLRPGAGLGLLWNLEQWQDLPWVGGLGPVLHGTSGGRHPTKRATWDVLDTAPGYEAPVSQRFRHEHVLDPDGVADLIGSWSRVAILPEDRRLAIRDGVRAIVPAGGASLPYETVAVAARTS
jgi:SAM-dependent methyltransferase